MSGLFVDLAVGVEVSKCRAVPGAAFADAQVEVRWSGFGQAVRAN